MYQISLANFNLAQICDSGQCFRMNKIAENTYSLIAFDRYIEVTQVGETCTFSCDEEEFCQIWRQYFDIDTDYAAMIGQADATDEYLQNAIKSGAGIRILRQDLWEMIVSFLISQQNNITRIRRCIQNICEQYGKQRRNLKGEVYYTFPRPEDLSALPEDALMACNLGYRSKYVVRTARAVAQGDFSLEQIARLPYEEAKTELLKLFGVGVKVADCICLFSQHHLQAFPVDTHIKQALEKHYQQGFPMERYKDFAGVMQQYIFYYELLHG